MEIRLLSIGTKSAYWLKEGFADYQKRFPSNIQLHLKELPSIHRRNRQQSVAEEGKQLLKHITPNDFVIALDISGQSFGSLTISKYLTQWQLNGQNNITILIGGASGLSQDCLNAANERWSLSSLTLPHALVRIVIAEQLYRGICVLSGHPYHQ